jgi:hypothetical protein
VGQKFLNALAQIEATCLALVARRIAARARQKQDRQRPCDTPTVRPNQNPLLDFRCVISSFRVPEATLITLSDDSCLLDSLQI